MRLIDSLDWHWSREKHNNRYMETIDIAICKDETENIDLLRKINLKGLKINEKTDLI